MDEILPRLIPEEAEKLNNSAPPWKIELVRDSLQYIIVNEDSGVEGSPDQKRLGKKKTKFVVEEDE